MISSVIVRWLLKPYVRQQRLFVTWLQITQLGCPATQKTSNLYHYFFPRNAIGSFHLIFDTVWGEGFLFSNLSACPSICPSAYIMILLAWKLPLFAMFHHFRNNDSVGSLVILPAHSLLCHLCECFYKIPVPMITLVNRPRGIVRYRYRSNNRLTSAGECVTNNSLRIENVCLRHYAWGCLVN